MRFIPARCPRRALLALLLVLPTPALADGILRDSYGAVSSGRGGASIAVPDSGSVIADNPGALPFLPSRGLFEIRLDSYIFDVKYSDPENSAGGPFHPAVIPEVTWARKDDDGRYAFGFSLFAPGGFSTQYAMQAPVIGDTKYEATLSFLKAAPAFAIKLNEHWSVGATLSLAYATAGLETPLFVQEGANAGLATFMDLDADGFGLSGGAGLYYETGAPGDRFSFGLTYTHGTHFSLKGESTTTFFGLGPDPITSEFDAKVEIDFPRSVGAGVSKEWGRTRASLDVIWTDWERAFDDIPLRLEKSSDPTFAGMTLRDRFPLEWNDRVSFRIGIQRQLAGGRSISAGYNYHPNPARTSTMTPLIPTVLEHTVSLGYTFTRGGWTFALAGQFSGGPPSRIEQSRIIGNEFDNAELDGYAFGLFLGASYAFD